MTPVQPTPRVPDTSERRGARWLSFGPLWAGETLSMFGSQVSGIALPLTAVQVLHASPAMMGLLTAMGWLPVVLFGLAAGVWVDRADQRRMMLVCNIFRIFSVSIIPVLAWLGGLGIGVVIAAAFVTGCFTVFFDVAYQTIVASLVAPNWLSWANSRLEVSRSTAQLVGPALAGVLISVMSAPGALTIDALSFFVAAVSIMFMPKVSRIATETAAPTGITVRRQLWDGVQVVRGSRVLVLLIAAGAWSNVFLAGIEALQMLFAVRQLHLPTSVLGLSVAAMGAAALLGALTITRVIGALGEHRVVLIGLVVLTIGAVVLALSDAVGGWIGFALAQVLFGLSGPLVNISLVTLRQRVTATSMLGRVNAIARVCIMASLPVGAVLAGMVAGWIGTGATLWVLAVGLAAVVVVFIGPLSRIDPTVSAHAAE